VLGKPRKLFYGWVIVTAGFLNQVLHSGLGFQGFGTFLLPLEREFGWSKATLAAARSLMQVESGLMGPLEGALVDRFGPKPIMLVGTFIFGLGLILVSLINSVWSYYLVFVVVALGTSLGGFLVMSVSINNWFRCRRTLAMSIAQTGLGVSGIIIIPLLLWSHATFGWRVTALGAGLSAWAIGIPVSLMVRRSPERYGVLPDGDEMPAPGADLAHTGRGASGEQPRGGGLIDFTLAEAIRTPAFWLLGFGHGLSIMVINAVTVHQFAHMEQGIGLSVAATGLAVGVMSVTNIIGRLAGGVLGDQYDKRYLSALGMLGAAVALVVFATAHSLAQTMVFSVLYGFSWGMRGPLMNSIRGEYFGRASFGRIVGFASLLTLPGALFGPIFAGIMADVLGDYVRGFIILAVLSGMGFVMFLAAKPPAPPARPRHPTGQTP
jgi:MFS family permease